MTGRKIVCIVRKSQGLGGQLENHELVHQFIEPRERDDEQQVATVERAVVVGQKKLGNEEKIVEVEGQ